MIKQLQNIMQIMTMMIITMIIINKNFEQSRYIFNYVLSTRNSMLHYLWIQTNIYAYRMIEFRF